MQRLRQAFLPNLSSPVRHLTLSTSLLDFTPSPSFYSRSLILAHPALPSSSPPPAQPLPRVRLCVLRNMLSVQPGGPAARAQERARVPFLPHLRAHQPGQSGDARTGAAAPLHAPRRRRPARRRVPRLHHASARGHASAQHAAVRCATSCAVRFAVWLTATATAAADGAAVGSAVCGDTFVARRRGAQLGNSTPGPSGNQQRV